MLKGQALINWWGEASDREKDNLIGEFIFGLEPFREGCWRCSLIPAYTSPDSPRRLVEEVEQKTIEKVGEDRWLVNLYRLSGNLKKHEGHCWHILALAQADTSTRCLACLLALEDQNGI
jgi:hypothetical protein